LGFFPKWGPTAFRGHDLSKALFSTLANSKYTPMAAEGHLFGEFSQMGPDNFKSIVVYSGKFQIHTNRCRRGPWGTFPKWGLTAARGHNISKPFYSTVVNSKYTRMAAVGDLSGIFPNGVRRVFVATTSQTHCILELQIPNSHK